MSCLLKEKLREKGLDEDDINKLVDEVAEADLVLAPHRVRDGVLRSEHSRNSYFQKRFLYVEPVAIRLGKNKKGVEAVFHYVPISKTLEAMLENEYVVAQCNNPLSETAGVLRDFTDGKVFQSVSLFHEHPSALKVLLFQDAFNVVNPLGSAKTKHKILAVYLILGNLYPWERSCVSSIKLCLLCREADFKYFGQSFCALVG